MYCYNCGGKVLPSANFCHHCGADLTLVHKTNSDVKDSSPADPEIDLDDNDTSQETKIFKIPLQKDEEELAHYIKKIDENVQQEVLTQEEKKKSLDRQAKAQKKEVKEDQGPKPQEKSRRSFKDIWNSFIDESDNPYSVFSQPEDDPSKISSRSDEEIKEENIILINEEAERSHNPSEDRFQTASDISNLTRQVNEVLEQEAKEAAKRETQQSSKETSKKETAQKDKTVVKEKSTGGGFKNFFKSFSKDSTTSDDKGLTASEVNKSKQKTDSSISTEKTQTTKAQTSSTSKVKEAHTEGKITHTVAKEEKSVKKPKFFNRAKDATKTKDTATGNATKDKSKTRTKSYLPPLAEVHKHYQQIIYKILDFGQGGIAAIFTVGLLALILPFILIDTKVSVAVILFMLIKILISFFTIYYAYIVATRNTGLYLDEKRIFVYAVFNWSIVNLLLFIFFLFYPHNTAIGYNFLGALTPKLIPTVLSYILVSFLTLACLYEDLDKDNYINFMGWFLTLYIGIELASKLFWVLIDFIFNSIL